MSDVDEVAQVLRVTIEGMDIFLKVTGGIWTNGKDFAKFLWNKLHKEKLQGKTSMRKLLLKGGDLQIFQFPNEYKQQIFKALKGYGVLFSELPDLNRKDGLGEILFHAEATNRVNDLIKNLNMGHFIDMEQYFAGGDKEEIKKEEEYFAEHFDPSQEPNKLTPEEKIDLTNRMKILDVENNPTKEDITITKRLVVEETKEAYLTKIPYERDKFFWIQKEDCLWIDGNKTLLVKLDKDKEYKILDRNGKPKEKVSGKALYKAHYDEVSISTKRRAMEASRKQKVENSKKRKVAKKKKGRN